MRVVHYSSLFSLLSETFVYDYIAELGRQGVENHVITHERRNAQERPFERVTVVPRPGLWNVRRLGYRLLDAVGLRERGTSAWPLLRAALHRELQRIRPDAVHAHFGPQGVLVAPVAKALDIPLVVTFYGYDVSKLPREERWRRAYGALFPQSACTIGISNHVCEKLIALGAVPKRVQMLHLGVQLDAFDFSDPRASFDGVVVRCLHVGRLVEKKAPTLLVEAFHRAREIVNGAVDLRLSIAGDGPLRSAVDRSVRALELEHRVDVLGSVPHDRVRHLLHQAQIYTQHCVTALDGDQEGQGVSFVEASATGRPIVATRHNGLPDVILDGETGFLVAEGDVEGMGAKIAELATKPALWEAFGRAGRRHIETHFCLEKQAAKAVALYRSVTQSAASRLQ